MGWHKKQPPEADMEKDPDGTAQIEELIKKYVDGVSISSGIDKDKLRQTINKGWEWFKKGVVVSSHYPEATDAPCLGVSQSAIKFKLEPVEGWLSVPIEKEIFETPESVLGVIFTGLGQYAQQTETQKATQTQENVKPLALYVFDRVPWYDTLKLLEAVKPGLVTWEVDQPKKSPRPNLGG